MEVRRNVYESNGKEATPADLKSKAANGEVSANGTSAEKSLEESLKEEIPKKFCQICGTDCTRAHWHNAKAATKFDVCPNCFKQNAFPSNHNRSDFVRMENKNYSLVPDREAVWTDEELLLLLEGLEMYDDDWNKISDHVGTRTREECVLKFLQLEIEDDYVEPDPQQKDPGLAVAYLGEGRVPFTQAENPVLSVMAFLAGLADPSVTAAAAGKSIEEVQRVMRQRIDGPGKSKGKEKASEGGAVQESSTEDVNMDLETVNKSPDKTREAITSLPFALTAARASALASHEERSLTRLIHLASNLQMQKLELKLQQFGELEQLLKLERKDVERRRQSLFLERLEFQRRQRTVEDALERALNAPSSSAAETLEAVKKIVRGAVSAGNLGVGKQIGADEIEPLKSGDAGYKGFSI